MDFLYGTTEELFVRHVVPFVVPFVEHYHVALPEVREEVFAVFRKFQIQPHDGTFLVGDGMQFQSGQDVSVLLFGQCVAAPCFGEPARRVRPVVPDFGAELFAGGKRQEAMEIIGFRAPHAMKWCQYFHHAGAQVTSVEPIAPSVHVEPFFRQLVYQRTGFPPSQAVLYVQDGIPQGHGAADMAARHVDGIKPGIA